MSRTRTLTTVLVRLDGSEFGERAIGPVARFTAAGNGEVVLLQVVVSVNPAVDDSDTYMTTPGLVIAALDAIPAPGASVVRGGHRWAVLEVDGPRVKKLRGQREP